MNTATAWPVQALAFTLLVNLFLPSLNAFAEQAHATAADIQIVSPAQPVWLIERPDDEGSGLTATTFGDSAYGDYHAKAGLVIGCHSVNSPATVTLQISPQALGFDSTQFEGKDAPSEGPLHLTTGKRKGVDLRVNGIWTHGGAFQVGTLFALNALIPLPRDKLAYLASDASRGQTLTLSLAPAKEGGERLTATFSLPTNNQGLKKVILPCLGSEGAATPVGAGVSAIAIAQSSRG